MLDAKLSDSPSPAIPLRPTGEPFRKKRLWEALTRFVALNPSYTETSVLDEVREKYFKRLDETGSVYLDYTGGSLYPSHLSEKYSSLLSGAVLGNPHSISPASALSSFHEERARASILAFLDADPELYDVILTPNATGAFKVIGESYPWKGKRLLMMMDSHNSVIGIGRLARMAGSIVEFIQMDQEDLTIREADLMNHLQSDTPGLVIFTGQSNVTGSKVRPSWLTSATRLGWHVALDAAALAPSTPISLRSHPVDFLALSVYKIVGFPTGVGALVVAKDQLRLLERKTFWGGTLDALHVPSLDFGIKRGHAGFEDGTINYLSLPAVAPGLEFVKPLLSALSIRIEALTRYLYVELSEIRFNDSQRTNMIRIRGPPPGPDRGGSLALVFYRPEMEQPTIEHYDFVVQSAAKEGISVRGAPCLCNYGGTVAILGLNDDQPIKRGSDIGYVRVSVGLASNFEDCYRFVSFCRQLADVAFYEEERLRWTTLKGMERLGV